MMWFDRLRFAVITLVTLIAAAGLGASFVAQRVAEEGRAPIVAGSQVQLDDKPGAHQVIEVSGMTDLDPATLTIVRSQIDGRVDRVFVDLGQAVKSGDPLIEIFSTDLAKAKNDFEVARSQHDRDLKTLHIKGRWPRGRILREGADRGRKRGGKSRLAMRVAKENLLIIGLTDEQIDKVADEDAFQKARMILRSRSDGILIKRAAVVGITTPPRTS